MRKRPEIIFFILLSILLHLVFLGFLARQEKPKSPAEVEVVLLKTPYQIADIQPPEKEERPEKAKFLGLYDSRVEKEQVAVTRSPRKEATAESREGEGMRLAARTPDETLESLPEDFYPDYQVGDRTYLNVLRFPKIGYFVRLKKIFKTTFNPVPAIRPYYLTNQVSRGQVEVVLGVSVDRTGDLAELFVINSSGLDLYDREAMRTVRDSSPFAAPPDDLLDKSSKLRMVWTFTVYL